MATEVDISSIFDTVLPNVYVKKVTLAPSVLAGSRRGVEYDPSALDQLEKNQFGKSQPNPSSVDFENIPRGSNGLIVTVDLVLKDRYSQSGKSFWFERDEILKYLNLRVVLSKRKAITEDLINGEFSPDYLKRARLQGKFEENIINLQKVRDSSLKSETAVTVDGQETYDVTYSTSFYLPNANPKNIAVFAHVFQDLNEVLRDKNVISRSNRRRYIQGNSTAQRILVDSSVVNNAFVYKLPNGKVWAGPIHIGPEGQTMAGAFHTQDRHSTLTASKVSNFLIEDYRILDDLAEPELMLHPVRPRRTPAGSIKTSQDIRVIKSEAYITEPIYSSDAQNVIKFVFHVDHEKIIRENTQYGALLKTADKKAKADILQRCIIKNFSVYRERVVRGLRRGKVKPVDYENRTELIANSSERDAGFLQRSVTKRSIQTGEEKSQKVRVGAIREVYLTPVAGNGIRSFGVTDYDMARETDGLYRYKVELEIEDGTVQFVKDQLDQLANAERLMQEYLNESSREGNFIPQTGKLSPEFIALKQQQYRVPTEEEITNNTTQQNAELLGQSVASSPWLNATSRFLDVLGNTSAIRYRKLSRAMKVLNNLCNPETATLQSIQVIINLIRNLESEITLKLGNLDARMGSVDYQERTSAFKGKLPNNTFKLVKAFKTIHDSNIQNNVGYDFLGGASRRSVGPRRLTTEQLEDRLNSENQKYFSVPYDARLEEQENATDTGAVSSEELDLGSAFYSYLTPAVIEMGDKNTLRTINRNAGLFARKQYNLMLSEILRVKPNIGSTTSRLGSRTDPTEPEYDLSPVFFLGSGYKDSKTKVSREIYEENLSNLVILDSLNVTISSANSYKTKMVLKDSSDGLEVDKRKFRNADSVLGSSVKFSTDRLSKEDIVYTEDLKIVGIEEEKDLTGVANSVINSLIDSNQSVFSRKGKKKIKAIEDLILTNEDNVVDEYFESRQEGQDKRSRFFRNLPNQIKSLILSSDGQTRKDWTQEKQNTGLDIIDSPEYTGLFYFLYNHINTIEVMVGFETNKMGKAQISKPIYRKLTADIFRRIQNENLTVMCRMVPYRNNVLGFKKSQKMRLPEFDSVFLLAPKQSDRIEPEERSVAVFQTASDFVEPEQREVAASETLVQSVNLNLTGRRLLQESVTSLVDQDQLPVEFSSTTVVQQPRSVTRVGTTFSSREKIPETVNANTANVQNRIFRQNQSSPTTRTSTAARSDSPNGSSTPMSSPVTTRNNTSGGGY